MARRRRNPEFRFQKDTEAALELETEMLNDLGTPAQVRQYVAGLVSGLVASHPHVEEEKVVEALAAICPGLAPSRVPEEYKVYWAQASMGREG